MSLIKLFSLLALVVLLFSCQKDKTPLDGALEEIQKSWTKEALNNFAKKDIKNANAEIFFTRALEYRNKYFRTPKDSTLLNYFLNLNIEHEDHMSGIIFISLHRKLNNMDIDLYGQLESIYKIQNELQKKRLKNYKRASKYIKKYKIGDTIFLRRPIDDGRNAVQYIYPEDSDWVYNDSLDLILKGIIISKNKIIDSLDIIYKMKVLSKNNEKVKVLMEDVGVNDTIEIDLRIDIIENSKTSSAHE